MSDAMPGNDGGGDTKGWDRASIGYRSRKPYYPDVTAADLRLPDEAGRLRTILLCTACGFGLTFLYVLIPLFAIGLFVPLGIVYPAALATAPVVLSAAVYVVSVKETRRFRAIAKDL